MDIASIVEKMDGIVKSAGDRSLTDAEVLQYEGFEKELGLARKSEELKKRHAVYQAPTGVSVITAASVVGKGDKELDYAFSQYLRTGQKNADIANLYQAGNADNGQRYTSMQTEGTNSQGGYLVPTTMLDRIIVRMKSYGGIASKAEEINTSSGNPIAFPTVDDTSNEGEIVAEGAATASGADVVFGTKTLAAFRYASGGADNKGIKVSLELAQDSLFDIAALVGKLVAIRIGRKQAKDLAVGTGSGQPLGLFWSVPDMNLATGNPFTYAKLLALVHKVDPEYRPNASWVMSDATVALIEGLVDGNNRPLLISQAMAGIGGTVVATSLLGWPVQIDQASPVVGDASAAEPGLAGDGFVAFGDIEEAYIVRRVQGVTILVDPFAGAANGFMTYHASARMDANIKNRNAYAILAGFHA